MGKLSKERQLKYLLDTIEACQEHPGRAEFKKVYNKLLQTFDDNTVATIINMGIRKKKIRHTLDNRLVVVPL